MLNDKTPSKLRNLCEIPVPFLCLWLVGGFFVAITWSPVESEDISALIMILVFTKTCAHPQIVLYNSSANSQLTEQEN